MPTRFNSAEERRTYWREKAARRRSLNHDKFLATVRKRDRKNAHKLSAYRKQWRQDNLDKRHAYEKQYRLDHPEECKSNRIKYRSRPEVLEKLRVTGRERARRKENRKRQWQRHLERYESDPVYNLAIKIRRRIHVALRKGYKGTRKAETSVKLLGCSYEDFKRHIELQFTEGMSWDGVFDGQIHIDHIKPVSSFNLLDPLQQKAAFHFTNCQPLWAQENLIKSASDKAECRKIIPFAQSA